MEHQSAKSANFTITFNGSTTVVQRPVSFYFVCELHMNRPLPVRPNIIQIISDLYDADSPICDGLIRGNAECKLRQDDYECRILLCEISFHLPKWARLAYALNVDQSDIESLQFRYQNYSFAYEAAYEMFITWLKRSYHTPTLASLVEALGSLGISLHMTTWKVRYDIAHLEDLTVSDVNNLDLSRNIKCHWKCVARLLGVNEDQVIEIEQNNERETIHEKAFQMLMQWRQNSGLTQTVQLFKALHCMREHTGDFGDVLDSMMKC